MQFVFRADASLQAGTGHVMRCLTLADELRRHGASASFICRAEPGNLIAHIKSRGYKADVLESGGSALVQQRDAEQCVGLLAEMRPDWIIVDHYALGREWEGAVRQYASKLFVIDDLADRDHDCDLLLDQNLYDGVEDRYAPLVPTHCRQLIGPRFALLRPEFAQFRSKVSRPAQPVSSLLVSFGGADSTNETTRIVAILHDLLPQSVSVDVVIGPTNPHGAQIKSLASDRPLITVHAGTDRMAELMALADAFIGAGGATTWERFCLGLPSLVIAVAENQVPTSQYLGKLGAIDYIGPGSEVTEGALLASLSRFLMDHERRAKMAALGMQLVDGLGAKRVSDSLLSFGTA